jgi:hypothetical protein
MDVVRLLNEEFMNLLISMSSLWNKHGNERSSVLYLISCSSNCTNVKKCTSNFESIGKVNETPLKFSTNN